ncbi:phage baseplate protein [Pantoea sp. ME81]|uniref:phage baseplate protein n=1 Tax=Pantoea sp. ME81 TaxID=2743935 RepID=UPI0015F4E0B9|nr:hypothetical protein [Pantoea sp. ME81]
MATSINSTSNTNSSSTSKSDNGFAIIASTYNGVADGTISSFYAICFDAVTDTGVRRNADITSYAVEDGVEVSDHVQIRNNQLTLTGVISESPVKRYGSILDSLANGGRVKAAIQYLDKIFDARQPIRVVTEHKSFDNIVLTGISYNYKTEDAMSVDLTFEQVRMVNSATANVSNIAAKTVSTKNRGGTVKTQKKSTQQLSPASVSNGNTGA